MAQDLAAIKANTATVPDRHLSVEQTRYLQLHLQQFTKQPIRISYLIGDIERQSYAQEFVNVLASPPTSGEASPGLPSMFNFVGIAIGVQDRTAVPEGR
jgi:hypothetical protein